MNATGNSRTLRLSTLLSALAVLIISATAAIAQQQQQDNGVALQRGYRTGYSDGYMAGYRDTIDSVTRDTKRHSDYTKADRAYSKDYGRREDYRDGYQQGFENGYDTGFDRRSFESNLPQGLKIRGSVSGDELVAQANSTTIDSPAAIHSDSSTPARGQENNYEPATYQSPSGPIIVIPRDIELILELQDDLNTEMNREGDRFTARVVSPTELNGATVEGRVSKVLKPGRIKRRSELLLSFDRILLSDGRWSNFAASLTEVMAVKGDNIKRVDNEGTAIGQSSLKGDVIKVGASTGTGAVIGGVVGGPVGVAVGAGMGAAFGVGAIVIERGKHIRLNRNQQLRVKTAYETRIR